MAWWTAVLLAVTGACGSDLCEKTWDMQGRCLGWDSRANKSEMLELCRSKSKPGPLRIKVECADKHSDCAGYKQCVLAAADELEETGRRRAIQGHIDEIEQAIASENLGAVMDFCYELGTVGELDRFPDVQELCEKLPKQIAKQVIAAADKYVDGTADTFPDCGRLSTFQYGGLETLIPDEMTAVKAACGAASDKKVSADAVAAAKQHQKEPAGWFPDECTRAEETLRDKPNLRAPVLQACYVELGASYLEREAKRKRCSTYAENVHKVVTSAKLSSPDLDRAMKAIGRVCPRW